MSVINHRLVSLFSCLSLQAIPFFHIPLLHPCLCHCGDEVVSIATTQELGVGALALKLAEKDGLH